MLEGNYEHTCRDEWGKITFILNLTLAAKNSFVLFLYLGYYNSYFPITGFHGKLASICHILVCHQVIKFTQCTRFTLFHCDWIKSF